MNEQMFLKYWRLIITDERAHESNVDTKISLPTRGLD